MILEILIMNRNNNREPGTPLYEDAPDVVWDLGAYPVNSKYPPDYKLYGRRFNGYKNEKRETLFYDFAVQRYDATFCYHGQRYYLGSFGDHVAVTDESYTKEFEIYPNANALIENMRIEGHSLITIIDELTDINPI